MWMGEDCSFLVAFAAATPTNPVSPLPLCTWLLPLLAAVTLAFVFEQQQQQQHPRPQSLPSNTRRPWDNRCTPPKPISDVRSNSTEGGPRDNSANVDDRDDRGCLGWETESSRAVGTGEGSYGSPVKGVSIVHEDDAGIGDGGDDVDGSGRGSCCSTTVTAVRGDGARYKVKAGRVVVSPGGGQGGGVISTAACDDASSTTGDLNEQGDGQDVVVSCTAQCDGLSSANALVNKQVVGEDLVESSAAQRDVSSSTLSLGKHADGRDVGGHFSAQWDYPCPSRSFSDEEGDGRDSVESCAAEHHDTPSAGCLNRQRGNGRGGED